MTEQEIQAYIQAISIFASMGIQVAGKVKELIRVFKPDNTLTDAQINAIEQAGIADSTRRKFERIAMGQART